ncbi:hypothetical protein Tco_0001427, partial [Tanacetum coccineum]
AVISKCLSGKSTEYDSLRLSQAQILWGMYHKKNVDYAYLLWEDFVYQVENKNVKRSNKMYYPYFTKVIVNFFMTKDSSIPRRNKVNWHFARDNPMFTMIKVVFRHEDTQLYGAILPDELTNEAIKDSESYKEYYGIPSGAEPLKTKASIKKKQVGSEKSKTPLIAKGKTLKTYAKAGKTTKKKQPAKTSKEKGLTVLSEVALTKAEQMKLAIKRSLIETHNSHKISWKSSDEENNDDDDDEDDDDNDQDNDDDDDDDDANNQDDDDNDGDDFVHPKLSTHDEEDKEEEDSDLRVHTPSNYKSNNDEESDEEIQGVSVKGEEMDEEETNEEDEANELYRDVKVNIEGRDTEMTDATRTIIQTTQVIEDTHVIITPVNPEAQQQSSSVSSSFVSNMLNPSLDTGINSIFNLNTESTSLIDVPVTTIAEPPLLSTTTLPPPPIPLITHLQQTPVPTPATAPSSSLQDLPNFGSLFSCQPSELELKKILIDKMESNKTIHRSDEQKNLYKALVDTYKSDKLILDTYEDTISFKRQSTSTPKEKTSKTTSKSTEGSKSHHKSAGKSAQAEEPMHTAKDLEEPIHQEFKTGVIEDQPDEETSQRLDWFQKPAKPPTPDRDWNKTLPDAHGPI